MPCTHSSSSSSWVEWPALSACSAATWGHSTTSPSSPGSAPGAGSVRLPSRCGGRSSSMGKASTSVGPGSPIHRSCKSVIVRSSTSSTESSASGWIRIWSSVNRATAASPTSSTSMPASLAISMLIGVLAALPPGGPGPVSPLMPPVQLLGLCVVALVRVDDLADQPVPDDVVAGEPREVDVLDAVEDVLHHAQPADLPGRQVDLGHVAGHHHLGTEAQPGEEHLHLLGRGVLRLVQDDERIIQGPSP